MTSLRHALTIDLEEQFQFGSIGPGVPERHWERFPVHIDRNVDTALEQLDRHGARATFFAGRWVAGRYGPLLARIAQEGHEIACTVETRHGRPRRDGSAAPASISALVAQTEGASGHVVHGCRAPRRQGRPGTGEDGAVAGSFRYSLWQGPVTATVSLPPKGWDGHARIVIPSLRIARYTFALRSGTSLRLLPDPMARRFIAGWGRRGVSRIFDFKLWELDPAPTELSILSPLERRLCYGNLARFGDRLGALLDQGDFVPLRDRLALADAPAELSTPRAAPPLENRATDTLPLSAGPPIAIVVPCYNEEAGLSYLANVLAALVADLGKRHPLSFLLVDDGSKDGTWSEMQRLFGGDARFTLVRHTRNRGVAAAILTGIAAARTEIVAVIDSDCSYDPARIEEMLPLLTPDVALVTASPYHALGGVEGVPEWRLVLSRGASRLYRMLLHNKLATYTSCFRVVRKSAVEGLELHHEGFIGVTELLARLDLRGWKIVEHPAVLEARLIGQSKLRIIRVIAGHLRLLAEITILRLAGRKTLQTAAAKRGEG